MGRTYEIIEGHKRFFAEHARFVLRNPSNTRALVYNRVHGEVHLYSRSELVRSPSLDVAVFPSKMHPEEYDSIFGILGCQYWSTSALPLSVADALSRDRVIARVLQEYGHLLEG